MEIITSLRDYDRWIRGVVSPPKGPLATVDEAADEEDKEHPMRPLPKSPTAAIKRKRPAVAATTRRTRSTISPKQAGETLMEFDSIPSDTRSTRKEQLEELPTDTPKIKQWWLKKRQELGIDADVELKNENFLTRQLAKRYILSRLKDAPS